MKFCSSLLLFLGRLAMSAIFLFAGIGKFVDYEGTMQYMASKGLSYIPFLLVAAALVEIISALALIIGYKTRLAAFLLFLFLIPTTYLFHSFWSVSPEEFQLQQIMFLKNLAIAGGLLYIMGTGPGSLALDRCLLCSYSSECRIEGQEG